MAIKTTEFYPGWAEEAGRKAGERDRAVFVDLVEPERHRADSAGRLEKPAQWRSTRIMNAARFENAQVAVDIALELSDEP